MIDRAIDKLKGELREKEREQIQPLHYRQKTIQEEVKVNKNLIENRIEELERMVMMQDQTIRCLLEVNEKNRHTS